MQIRFFVPGVPKPGGSKKAFVNKKTGRASVVEDCEKSKDWRASVAHGGRDAYDGELLDEPLAVSFRFVVVRPQDHYGTGRNAGKLKPRAPRFPATKPDSVKLSRSTEDALTGVIWRDDSVIVTHILHKRYGSKPGCLITVQTMDELEGQ